MKGKLNKMYLKVFISLTIFASENWEEGQQVEKVLENKAKVFIEFMELKSE